MSYKILDDEGQPIVQRGKELMASDLRVPIEKRFIDKDKRIIEVTVSSDRRDRDGDRIDQQGIDHSHANAVLYAHDYGQRYLPIGKIISNRRAKRKDDDGKPYTVTTQQHHFNPPKSYELSDAIREAFGKGIISRTQAADLFPD